MTNGNKPSELEEALNKLASATGIEGKDLQYLKAEQLRILYKAALNKTNSILKDLQSETIKDRKAKEKEFKKIVTSLYGVLSDFSKNVLQKEFGELILPHIEYFHAARPILKLGDDFILKLVNNLEEHKAIYKLSEHFKRDKNFKMARAYDLRGEQEIKLKDTFSNDQKKRAFVLQPQDRINGTILGKEIPNLSSQEIEDIVRREVASILYWQKESPKIIPINTAESEKINQDYLKRIKKAIKFAFTYAGCAMNEEQQNFGRDEKTKVVLTSLLPNMIQQYAPTLDPSPFNIILTNEKTQNVHVDTKGFKYSPKPRDLAVFLDSVVFKGKEIFGGTPSSQFINLRQAGYVDVPDLVHEFLMGCVDLHSAHNTLSGYIGQLIKTKSQLPEGEYNTALQKYSESSKHLLERSGKHLEAAIGISKELSAPDKTDVLERLREIVNIIEKQTSIDSVISNIEMNITAK